MSTICLLHPVTSSKMRHESPHRICAGSLQPNGNIPRTHRVRHLFNWIRSWIRSPRLARICFRTANPTGRPAMSGVEQQLFVQPNKSKYPQGIFVCLPNEMKQSCQDMYTQRIGIITRALGTPPQLIHNGIIRQHIESIRLEKRHIFWIPLPGKVGGHPVRPHGQPFRNSLNMFLIMSQKRQCHLATAPRATGAHLSPNFAAYQLDVDDSTGFSLLPCLAHARLVHRIPHWAPKRL
ncbi:crossover junction endodeoxyribonuclease RuvC [Alicyclobacillus hesperidum URH17-3-68]|nr:crossover junction endodeoxyribonuclease RuvC [Alicyclobacillus hesperidum URH17-3-68]